MSQAWWAVFGIAAVLVFWMLGAHNRLMALRNAVSAAFAQLDELLKARGQSVATLTTALREPLPHEHVTLDALLVANTQVLDGTAALRGRTAQVQLLTPLAAAEASLASSLARTLALLQQHPALLTEPTVAPLVLALREAEPRLAYARQLFNEAVATYNAAAQQVPTVVVARAFGFALAAPL
jgi:LemA protein